MTLLLWILWFLTELSAEEVVSGTSITCTLFKECILPCPFPASYRSSVVWTQLVDNSPTVVTHDALQGGDPQVSLQFTGRASLVPKWSTRGDASLRLNPVLVRDQGRYLCETLSPIKYSAAFIILTLEAPVSNLLLRLEGNSLSCSSEDLYPVPQLHWSTQPPSNTSHHHTTVLQTQQQLYNISSSLTLPADQRHLVVTCTVSSGGKKRKTATWRLLGSDGSSSSELTFSCPAPSGPPSVWMFNRNEVIASLSGASYRVMESWRNRVVKVSLSGDLTLKDWRPLDGEGIVTCHFTDAEGMTTIDHFVKFLQVVLASSRLHCSLLVLLAAILVVAVAVLMWKWKLLRNRWTRFQNGRRGQAVADKHAPNSKDDDDDDLITA